jgi:hypothetical protein
MLSHFNWDMDAFTIMFCATKSDKEGARTNANKHIYCNPYEPELCPLLSLAIYTWYLNFKFYLKLIKE